MLIKQEAFHNQSCGPGVRQSVPMDRADSDFGESSMNTNEARESPSKDSHQIQHCHTPTLDPPPEDLKAALDPISQLPESNARTQTDSSKSSMSTLPTSTRPTIAQRNITRRSSGTPSSHRGSTPPSRRSSFAAPQPVNSYNRRPLFPNKSISAAYGRSLGEDPFLAHRRSKQIFQTFDTPHPGQSQMRPDDQRSLAFPSLPDLPCVPSTPITTAISQAEEANPDLQHQYANHVPATVIDWTLPSTRRLEYREIDKSCQGFRGMWRRLAPRWCRRNRRLSFFDGNDSDAGSVRRYRLDLPEVKKENKADGVDITEQEIALGLGKTKRKWSLLCFKDWPGR